MVTLFLNYLNPDWHSCTAISCNGKKKKKTADISAETSYWSGSTGDFECCIYLLVEYV